MAGTTNQKERMLATQVRQLSLNLINKYLQDESQENEKFRKDLLLKLAGTILPRKTEVTGEDGQPIMIMPAELINKNATNPEPIDNSERPTQV